jgi:hypothetical protein
MGIFSTLLKWVRNQGSWPMPLLLTIVMSLVGLLISGFALAEETAAPSLPPLASGPQKEMLQLAPASAQDTQFLALLRARDSKFGLVQELRRILTYHDSFRDKLE